VSTDMCKLESSQKEKLEPNRLIPGKLKSKPNRAFEYWPFYDFADISRLLFNYRAHVMHTVIDVVRSDFTTRHAVCCESLSKHCP